jgi:hypothetical protein
MVAVGLMVGVACSGDDDDAAPAGSGAGQQAPGANEANGPAEPAPDDAGGGPATTAPAGESGGAGTRPDGEVLASVRAELPASLNDRRLVPLRIDVVRFDRTGDLIELDMVLTNEADPSGQEAPGFTPWASFADLPSGADLSGIGLLVTGEQKLYLPAFDDGGGCLCTGNLSSTEIAAGESLPIVATFGGVPGDAETLDLRIPSFPIIEGLEVAG